MKLIARQAKHPLGERRELDFVAGAIAVNDDDYTHAPSHEQDIFELNRVPQTNPGILFEHLVEFVHRRNDLWRWQGEDVLGDLACLASVRSWCGQSAYLGM